MSIGLKIHLTKLPATAFSISSFIALALTASTSIFQFSSNDISFSNLLKYHFTHKRKGFSIKAKYDEGYILKRHHNNIVIPILILKRLHLF